MTVQVRRGNIDDFSRLDWAWQHGLNTQKVYRERIEEGLQEFWVVESTESRTSGNYLLGEFHIVWTSPDLEEADGVNRAYLCAFRIHPDHRGEGHGKTLLNAVLNRLREQGRDQATIGVKQNRPEIRDMYYKWGFTELVKIKEVDNHNFDEQGNPNPVDSPIELYLKKLSKSEVQAASQKSEHF